MLDEQELKQLETQLHVRQGDIETFQSFVTDMLKTAQVKQEPDSAEHVTPVKQMSAHSTHSSNSVERLRGVDMRKSDLADSVALPKDKEQLGLQMKEIALQIKTAMLEFEGMKAELRKEIKKAKRRNTRLPVYSDDETDRQSECSSKYSDSVSSHGTFLYSSRDSVNSIHTEPKATPSKRMTSPSHHGDREKFSFTAKELNTLLNNRSDELPRKEPNVFSGSVYDYPMWKKSFDALIERKVSVAADRLYYLGRYTSGEAKEAIKCLLLQDTDEAYTKAKKLLADRYGNKWPLQRCIERRSMTGPQ
ncbi:uncharacterized protein [Ptychodera flava]|uniref:uncharacterized protein n=1 Tax=Ptychodera flava TaxID=63121 RepID=UPI00396A7AD7